MKRYGLFLFLTGLFSLFSCSKIDPGQSGPHYLQGNGVFVLNEGNFMAGNGSLSFFSYDSSKIYNNVFSVINNRPLGDVPFSMVTNGSNGYIVVNNSGKVEVIDINTLKSDGTFTGLNSPRNILFVSSTKAYISSLYSKKIAVLNLVKMKISGYIDIRRTSESMVSVGNKVYISSWYQGNELMVVNSTTDKVIDSLVVGHEPESMVVDKNNKLWVLCSGSYSGLYFPELISINTSTGETEKRLTFSSKLIYPTSLQINKTRDTLYYIEGSLWKLGITASSLPDQSFVPSKGRLFYKLGIDPDNGLIFATNVIDYQQRGFLMKISPKGVVIDSMKADIIPGGLCFRKI
jgi:DNA-binding beta-propeller fold protein YncE